MNNSEFLNENTLSYFFFSKYNLSLATNDFNPFLNSLQEDIPDELLITNLYSSTSVVTFPATKVNLRQLV